MLRSRSRATSDAGATRGRRSAPRRPSSATTLARGAKAVLLGRPVLWGLACDGQAGVERVLRLLTGELELAMVLAGAPTLADLGGDLVRPVP